MDKLRRTIATSVLCAAVAAGSLLSAAPAAAAAYNGACGSGYAVVNRIEFPDDRGTAFLTYNSSNGYNCVVTVRTNPGAATHMEAMVRRTGESAWVRDSGNYTTYAGPVYRSGAGYCMNWGGTIGNATITLPATNCG
jgi:uncharacterized protein YcsI (UPF0317 family)